MLFSALSFPHAISSFPAPQVCRCETQCFTAYILFWEGKKGGHQRPSKLSASSGVLMACFIRAGNSLLPEAGI